ncbi:glycosyltransferase family 2 protein [Pontibacter sp. 13R65]|uniref:glycosyltransferase family 2 protein n=1 Tax=Pontibacter sp. 13R65 TaxID=3127458 RepID=UPI00301D8F3C
MISEVSILIPVFNYDVRPLVEELLRQCLQLDLTFEILLIDDGSEEEIKFLNRALCKFESVDYRELPENIGRSAIRNMLATQAQYRYLLMLDNDCMPAGKDFIASYLAAAAKSDVVVGGISYTEKAPAKTYRLHWKYGQRAAKPSYIRQSEPYQDIYLSNAFMKRDLFLQYRLCEKLKHYGHEDTMFAIELKRNKVKVKHTENPALHLGLETTQVFLTKTEQAIANLVKLYNRGVEVEQLKIVKAYKALQYYNLDRMFISVARKCNKLFLLNFTSKQPNLLLFDLYRLQLFCSKMQTTKVKQEESIFHS